MGAGPGEMGGIQVGGATANKYGCLGSEITGVNLCCGSVCHLHVCLALGSGFCSGIRWPELVTGLIPILKTLKATAPTLGSAVSRLRPHWLVHLGNDLRMQEV